MTALLHSGVALVLGGVTYTVPPLSLGTIEKFEAQIEGVESLSRIAQLRLTLDLAHAALVRNYPEMTRDQVADLVDVVNGPRVYAAVMGHSIPAPDPSELSSKGEVRAMANAKWDWPAIYAHLCTSLGWTFDHCRRNVTLHDLQALTRYWRGHPPVHVAVAAYLGYGKKSRTEPASDREIASELTAIAGPVRDKFVPPVRMQAPAP